MLRSSQAATGDSGVGRPGREASRTGADKTATPTHESLSSFLESQSKNDSPAPAPQAPVSNPQAASPASPAAAVGDLTIYEKAEKIKTTRFHIVRKEETLSAIAQQYYGTPAKWQKILDANKNVIKDPNKLQPGTKLIIPD